MAKQRYFIGVYRRHEKMIKVKVKNIGKILETDDEVIVPTDDELYRKAKLIQRLKISFRKI